MGTRTASQRLLTDETWAQIPRVHADRRAVGAALLVLLVLVAAIVAGSTTGTLLPHLSHESGSTTPVAATHSVTLRADIHNDGPRAWTITGATINAPGVAHDIKMTKVNIPAHATRTVAGVVRVDDCAAIPAVQVDQATSYDIDLRIDRLLGASTFTIDGISADQLTHACGG